MHIKAPRLQKSIKALQSESGAYLKTIAAIATSLIVLLSIPADAATCYRVKLSNSKPSITIVAKKVAMVHNLGPSTVTIKQHNLRLAPSEADLWLGHPGTKLTAALSSSKGKATVKICNTQCMTEACISELMK